MTALTHDRLILQYYKILPYQYWIRDQSVHDVNTT